MADEQGGGKKKNNILPCYGNDSMNLNPLILTNIQSSVYFKVTLFQLKTYHEVIDEIYYQVKHLEPWERGSRKGAGTGMCGSVRGVGSGGIVSSAFCLLYKLYTLKLTRKQVMGLINHADSPYIRGLGFMYLRFTQPPSDLFEWYEEYLQDEEEIDVKAGGGQNITIGTMCRQFLTKLDWFSTLFPRIPVPAQKQIEQKLSEYDRNNGIVQPQAPQRQVATNAAVDNRRDRERDRGGERFERGGGDRAPKEYRDERRRSRSPEQRRRGYEDEGRYSRKSHSRERHSSKSSKYREKSRSRSKERKDRSRKYEHDEGRSSKRY